MHLTMMRTLLGKFRETDEKPTSVLHLQKVTAIKREGGVAGLGRWGKGGGYWVRG